MPKKEAKFLSYTDATTDRKITIEIAGADLEERITSLKEQGCTNFERLDADKNPVKKTEDED